MKLTTDIRESMKASVLCWLATTDDTGAPNVSPKEMFVPHGADQVLVADIASPGSVKNIQNNSAVCVSFIDIFKQKGYKLRGEARIVERDDARFPSLLAVLHETGGEAFPVRNIIEISVVAALPIVAPSYWLFPEITEQRRIDEAMQAYGVKPEKSARY